MGASGASWLHPCLVSQLSGSSSMHSSAAHVHTLQGLSSPDNSPQLIAPPDEVHCMHTRYMQSSGTGRSLPLRAQTQTSMLQTTTWSCLPHVHKIPPRHAMPCNVALLRSWSWPGEFHSGYVPPKLWYGCKPQAIASPVPHCDNPLIEVVSNTPKLHRKPSYCCSYHTGGRLYSCRFVPHADGAPVQPTFGNQKIWQILTGVGA